MKVASSGPVILYFPNMHESLIPSSLPSELRLLDPGNSAGKGGRTWAPEGLPYAPNQVRGMLRDYLAFGERFSRPADMGYFEVRGLEDFYTDSRQAIQSELQAKKKDRPDDSREKVLQKAQMVLALGMVFEERLAEMRTLENRVARRQADFARELGIEPAAEETTGGSGELVSWERLLEPFLLFLPPDGVLLVSDPAVKEWLEGRGVRFSPLEGEESEKIFPGRTVSAGCALARVRHEDILSPESARMAGPGEFLIVFWEAGS
jgi:hypothetical protein